MPRSLPAATPTKARGKSKGNRSVRCIPGGNEAIWDDELHTALIEALNIYPPMGRQRVRPLHDGGESHTSLGRCQLIQQYLKQRTGKNRTRKQISSRIQRLRRMHQDDPAMADILRVLPDYRQPTTPEILADFDFNDFNDSSGAATIFVPVDPATPPLLDSVGSSACSSPSTNPLGDSYQSSGSSSSVQSSQLTLRLFEAAELLSVSGDSLGVSAPCNEQENISPGSGLCLPDRPVHSLSRRRMASNIPTLRFPLELPPSQQLSFPNPEYGFDSSTQSVETGLISLAGSQFPYLNCHGQPAAPITPIDQITHTPEFPPQVLRFDKRSPYQPSCTDKDSAFPQPVTCVPSLSPYDPHPGSLSFAAAEYSSSKPSPFHTSRVQNYSSPPFPLASFHASAQGASSCLVPFEVEGCQSAAQEQDITYLAHLPRRLSYHGDLELMDAGLSLRMPSGSATYPCLSEEGNMATTLGRLELAPPAVIRPFFTSDFPCPASGSSPRTPLDEFMAASVHDGSLSL